MRIFGMTKKGKNINNEKYSFGYKDYVLQGLRQRNIEWNAKFVLPYLKPDMKMLDCGCGPGAITVGFAEKLIQGQVIAVDIEKSQLEIAKELARKNNMKNVVFNQADILNLPFADNTFDIAFTHAVICQLREYQKAISELKRVVKKGGIVAVREPDFGGWLHHPVSPIFQEAIDYREKALLANGFQPHLGRKLREIFYKLDFKNTIGSASNEYSGDKKSIGIIGNFWAKDMLKSPYHKKMIENGEVTIAKLHEYSKAWLDFIKIPYAFVSRTWCEVVGINL
jgi:ubiquinone/menaquinone biosynthesis C-methylase UbiE